MEAELKGLLSELHSLKDSMSDPSHRDLIDKVKSLYICIYVSVVETVVINY